MAADPALNPKILEQLKGHGLVLYDGDCGFCQFWVQFILDHDPAAYFVFAPLQASWVGAIYRPPNPEFDSVLLYENGVLYEKSKAAFRIAGHLTWPWRLARIFSILPSWIPNIIYDAVAKSRHSLAFEKSCRFPTAEERKRFL
jgi:predicted DCC family thiol-disulfide oxidoreductase YuxK